MRPNLLSRETDREKNVIQQEEIGFSRKWRKRGSEDPHQWDRKNRKYEVVSSAPRIQMIGKKPTNVRRKRKLVEGTKTSVVRMGKFLNSRGKMKIPNIVPGLWGSLL